MADSKSISKTGIVEKYIDYVLDEEQKPSSVHKFCKAIKISESTLYNHFGNLNGIETFFWQQLTANTLAVLEKDEAYQEYTGEHKLLGFYYTLFENMLLYRGFILFLSEHQKMGFLSVSHTLRKEIAPELEKISHDIETSLSSLPQGIGQKITSEGLWLQFVTIFKFWLKDESPNLESTDAFIEKTVNLSTQLSNSLPVDSIIDFGKFILKEAKRHL